MYKRTYISARNRRNYWFWFLNRKNKVVSKEASERVEGFAQGMKVIGEVVPKILQKLVPIIKAELEKEHCKTG